MQFQLRERRPTTGNDPDTAWHFFERGILAHLTGRTDGHQDEHPTEHTTSGLDSRHAEAYLVGTMFAMVRVCARAIACCCCRRQGPSASSGSVSG
jgi:hypothetical protein